MRSTADAARELQADFEQARARFVGTAERARRDELTKSALREAVMSFDRLFDSLAKPVAQLAEEVARLEAENERLRERVRQVGQDLEELEAGEAGH